MDCIKIFASNPWDELMAGSDHQSLTSESLSGKFIRCHQLNNVAWKTRLSLSKETLFMGTFVHFQVAAIPGSHILVDAMKSWPPGRTR